MPRRPQPQNVTAARRLRGPVYASGVPAATKLKARSLRLLGAPVLDTGSEQLVLPPKRPYQLLAFLACRRNWVARSELAELCWPDRPEGAARTNLRVLLQRAQRLVDGLELQAERVRWPVPSDLQRLDLAAAEGRDEEVLALAGGLLMEGMEPGLPEPLLEWLGLERQRLAQLAMAAARRRAAASPPTGGADDPAGAGTGLATPGFVGRRAELADMAARLAAGDRGVVIIGPGGVGKSALLRAALSRLAPHPADFVGLIDLVDLRRVDELPAAAARVAGLALRAGAEAWPQLEDHLRHRSGLLALDNAEHLEGLAPALLRLLAAAPRLALLIATRDRLALGAAGVGTLSLEGLPLPDEDETEPEALRCFDAVRLLEDRTRDTVPGLQPALQPASLHRVLRATAGLPLALELAAAALRLMPLEAVAEELSVSLDVLDASDPQRGLRACFDRSWARLDAELQAGLARLAWLPGSFDHGMAAAVAGVSLAGLATLVDRSLLQAQPNGRLALHPLLRQYVSERAPVADVEALATRHASQVAHGLEALDAPHLLGPAALQRLDALQPHLLAAWSWAVARRAPALQARFARVMGAYFLRRGRAREILPFFNDALTIMPADTRAGVAARAVTLRTQAMLEYHAGELALAAEHAREALRWAGQAGDGVTATACLTVLGNALLFAGHAQRARGPFQQALRRATARGDWAVAGAAANGLGLVARAAGRLDEALANFREQLRLAASQGDSQGQLTALVNIGNLQTLLHDWPAARQSNEHALALALGSCAEGYIAILHTVLAEIAVETGDIPSAVNHARQATAALARNTSPVVAVELPLVRLRIALAEDAADTATEALAEAVAAARRLGSTTQQLSCLIGAGRLLAGRGDTEAVRLWRFVRAHPAATHSLRAEALRCLALQGRGRAGRTLPQQAPADLLELLLQRLAPWIRG